MADGISRPLFSYISSVIKMRRHHALSRSAFILFVTLICLQCAFLVSCVRVIDDCSDELILHRWEKEFDTGVIMELYFEGDNAVLRCTSGEESAVLRGLCVLDTSGFVICDDKTKQNYMFTYTVHGDLLELTYDNATIVLDKSG